MLNKENGVSVREKVIRLSLTEVYRSKSVYLLDESDSGRIDVSVWGLPKSPTHRSLPTAYCYSADKKLISTSAARLSRPCAVSLARKRKKREYTRSSGNKTLSCRSRCRALFLSHSMRISISCATTLLSSPMNHTRRAPPLPRHVSETKLNKVRADLHHAEEIRPTFCAFLPL